MKSTTPVPGAKAAGDHRHSPRTTPRILPLGAVAGGLIALPFAFLFGRRLRGELRRGRAAGHRRAAEPARDELPAAPERDAGQRRGGRLARQEPAVDGTGMLDPGLFLLDEPTANLAPAIAGSLLEEHVHGLAASGAAVLVVEQRARAVLAISDRTYVLGGGEVRMQGTPAELSASPEFVESFLGGRVRPVGSAEN